MIELFLTALLFTPCFGQGEDGPPPRASADEVPVVEKATPAKGTTDEPPAAPTDPTAKGPAAARLGAARPAPPELPRVAPGVERRVRLELLTREVQLDRHQRVAVERLLVVDLEKRAAAEVARQGGGPGRALPPAQAGTGPPRRGAKAKKAGPPSPTGAPPAKEMPPDFGILAAESAHLALRGLRLTTVEGILRVLEPRQLAAFGQLVGMEGLLQLRQLAAARRLTTGGAGLRAPGGAKKAGGRKGGKRGRGRSR